MIKHTVLVINLLFVTQGIWAKKLTTSDNEVVTPEKDQLDLLAEDEQSENELDNTVDGGYVPDPCLKVRCGAGKVCEANDKGEGVCVCIPECPPETDTRRKVCSNHNETWNSDCELYQMRCFCSEGTGNCKNKKYKHGHVDYYGSCRAYRTRAEYKMCRLLGTNCTKERSFYESNWLTTVKISIPHSMMGNEGVCREKESTFTYMSLQIGKCSEEQMADFPRRMREWLFNVMQDLAQRSELHDNYLQLEREAEKDLSKKWSNAIIWKFCDLDSHPFDRSVSRHELFPLRAPLLAMEHCIAPFLDSCDADDDHRISLKEWGLCLGLEENEIEDKCTDIRDNDE